nr:serine carboxypeptidase-like 16 [Tanacetum cinerariifolium]
MNVSAVENCRGDYVNTAQANSLCLNSLQRYEECTSGIDLKNILDPVCDKTDPKPSCQEYYYNFIIDWANNKAVQQALNVREGTIGKWELFNTTLHYFEGKNDTSCYSYDIFSSFAYHKKLASKDCRALIFSGDHDMTFPYVGVEQWIAALNLGLDSPWEPFYVDAQVGGYEMTYAHNDFSMTYATIKPSMIHRLTSKLNLDLCVLFPLCRLTTIAGMHVFITASGFLGKIEFSLSLLACHQVLTGDYEI